MVNLRYFDFFIMIVITLSSIALACEDPVDEKSIKNEILNNFDFAFTGVFAIEMILKVIIIFFNTLYICNIILFFIFCPYFVELYIYIQMV